MKGSKNSPTNKGEKIKGKYALSDDCLNCKNKCKKGEQYLRKFSIKKQGCGVWCDKK